MLHHRVTKFFYTVYDLDSLKGNACIYWSGLWNYTKTYIFFEVGKKIWLVFFHPSCVTWPHMIDTRGYEGTTDKIFRTTASGIAINTFSNISDKHFFVAAVIYKYEGSETNS